MNNTTIEKKPKIWQVKTPIPTLQQVIARQLGVSPVTAQLLINRGLYTTEQCRSFIDCSLDHLHDPRLMTDMDKGVARITAAVSSREQVLIYGDYDTDGITATVLLFRLLQKMGCRVEFYIPHRLTEGYGLHRQALEYCLTKGITLIITVDCGINAFDEGDWAAEQGLDLIITDHHEPLERVPRGIAIIDPKRHDCAYPFKELAGVGVALKLAQALLEHNGAKPDAWQDYLDLCCLGTVADVVPLLGENRVLVKHGLERLSSSTHPGILALKESCGLKDGVIAKDISYRLAPCLNAAGRMAKADVAVELLLTEDRLAAKELTEELQVGNTVRQEISNNVLAEALGLIEGEHSLAEEKVLVLSSRRWHPGVVGIIAARLADLYYRPVILIALEEGIGKGSARSIPSFNLYSAMQHCQEYLQHYGGHAQAAGITLSEENIEGFAKAINQYADEILDEKKMTPLMDVEAEVGLNQLTERFMEEISLLEPFGQGNSVPLLACRNATVVRSRGVGKTEAHLKMLLQGAGKTVDSIGFGFGKYSLSLIRSGRVDLAFALEMNEFNGRRNLQLSIKDLGMPAVWDRQIQGSYAEDAPLELTNERHFWPEYIEELVYGKQTGLGPSPVASGGDGVADGELPQVIPVDGDSSKLATLGSLTMAEGPTLILANSVSQAVEITYYLRLSFPDLPRRVEGLFDGRDPSKLANIAGRFTLNADTLLITTPNLAISAGLRAQRVILYQLPYCETTYKEILALAPSREDVFLYLSAEDLAGNRGDMEALSLDRELLAPVYTLLRRQVQGNQPLLIDPQEVSYWIKDKLGRPSRDFTVHGLLLILEELELITAKPQGNKIHITLLPLPTEKKDLPSSPTYQRLLRGVENSVQWMERFATANWR